MNFVPQPQQVFAEMARVVRPGAVIAAYVWDYAGKIEPMFYFWDAAVALDAAARELDEDHRFPICQLTPLAGFFEQAGLSEIDVRSICVAINFRDFDDYWTLFMGGQAPAPGYAPMGGHDI